MTNSIMLLHEHLYNVILSFVSLPTDFQSSEQKLHVTAACSTVQAEDKVSGEPVVTMTAQQYSSLLQTQHHLQQQNQSLKAVNTSLQEAVTQLKQGSKRQSDQLRGAKSQATKYKQARSEAQAVSGPTIKRAVSNESGSRTHTPYFMAGLRFIKHACLLSNQKTSLALDLMYQVLTHEAPSSESGCEVSPTTLSRWNVLLGEVDRLNLRKELESTTSDICLFADDSNKGHEERHIMGVHLWSNKLEGPVGYVLTNSIIASTKGKDQAATDHHVLTTMFGVKSVAGVVGDNASTQSGAKKGQAVELGRMLDCDTFFIGCYPHIVNIALRTAIADGFGGRGSMSEFNLHQLHYKVAYVHHQQPGMYKSLYVSEKITVCPPPLPQEFVETRWTYMSEHLDWWWQYGDACVQLGKTVLASLPKVHSHYHIWREIIQMAANPILCAERCLLWEVLHDIIMPALHDCQKDDDELGFSCGYLARSWPTRVIQDMRRAEFKTRHPERSLTQTMQAVHLLESSDQERFVNEIMPAFTAAVQDALRKHASRWLQPPLLLCMGASTAHRVYFWRAWLRVMGYSSRLIYSELPIAREHYDILVDIALSEGCEEVVSSAVDMVLATNISVLTNNTDVAWLDEFIILATVAEQKDSLTQWKTRWAMSDAALLQDITTVANCSKSSAPQQEQEPHLWAWCCKHVFSIPVNNAIAERQFNIASLYLSASESESSKQSSHLFVENILHAGDTKRRGDRVTAQHRCVVREQMVEYCSSVTTANIQQAQNALQLRNLTGQSDGRTKTSFEVYKDALSRHKQRLDHDEDMVQLEQAGRAHSVAYLPTRKADSVLAEKRSFPAQAATEQGVQPPSPKRKSPTDTAQAQ